MRERRPTSTSNFGVGRRRATTRPPSTNASSRPSCRRTTRCSRRSRSPTRSCVAMPARWTTLDDGSVALVVTSPPYFAGKHYEEELETRRRAELVHRVPRAAARRVRRVRAQARARRPHRGQRRQPRPQALSQPVGRRHPRSCRTDLGLLLRGEIIWQKGEGASGSCAWGSFRSAGEPRAPRPHRAGRRSRAKAGSTEPAGPKQRAAEGLPQRADVDDRGLHVADARRVGDRARRARAASDIPRRSPSSCPSSSSRLYTYADDLVLDPFMGSGIAARRRGPHGAALRRLRPRPDVRRHRPPAGGDRGCAR